MSLESHKKDILNRLQEAGAKGLSKTGLGVSSSKKSLKNKAIEELEREQKIGNLGTAKKSRYVLQEFNTPLKIAYKIIEKKALSAGMTLFSRTKLVHYKEFPAGKVRKNRNKAFDRLVKEKKLSEIKRKSLTYFVHGESFQRFVPEEITTAYKLSLKDEIIQWLIKMLTDERKLIKLKDGKKTYFLHNASFQSVLSVKETPSEHTLSREEILKAYHNIRQRIGFSNIEIYELQKELGAHINELKEFLLEESRNGRAVLTLSDWSIASEEVRSGAIYLGGKPHLLVRFEEQKE